MGKLEEAAMILTSLGLPQAQTNESSCLTLLALSGLAEDTPWSATSRPMLRILDIMAWMAERYNKKYAANSRETVRRKTIHQFEQAGLVHRNADDPKRPTNSGNTNYQLTESVFVVLTSFGTPLFENRCQRFIADHGNLSELYKKQRNLHRVPVTLGNGKVLELSPGDHNDLQRRIIEDFGSRYAPGSHLLYLGDTENKLLHVDQAQLAALNIPKMSHEKLPDVVLFDSTRNWLFLVEAVTSHGPVSPKRHAELEQALKDCSCGRVYVTAFLNFSGFRKYASEIVWESEVWIAEAPDHLIHYNGDRFLGPYN